MLEYDVGARWNHLGSLSPAHDEAHRHAMRCPGAGAGCWPWPWLWTPENPKPLTCQTKFEF